MSYRPKAFGFFWPTGCVRRPELPSYQAYSSRLAASSPNEYFIVLRARQAYSHSASVGSRYPSPPNGSPASER